MPLLLLEANRLHLDMKRLPLVKLHAALPTLPHGSENQLYAGLLATLNIIHTTTYEDQPSSELAKSQQTAAITDTRLQ